MSGQDRSGDEAARRAADNLAFALEEAGFDVGPEFPALNLAMGRHGTAVVRIGDVEPAVADQLAAALITRPRWQEEDADSK
jgi:hypothetical protein